VPKSGYVALVAGAFVTAFVAWLLSGWSQGSELQAIDDSVPTALAIGRGYSALSYLRDLPIDEVELDRNSIVPMLVDPRAATVVRAVLELAGGLGLTAVAEGIENAETTRWLRDHGCRVGQGHLLSLLDRVGAASRFGSIDPR
jgi:predicted signal transduction protein with EAL and GGDEF domain